MARAIAFLCFGLAAFAWVPPHIDRAGLAALGLAFLAWSVGRALRVPWKVPLEPAPPAALAHPELIEPMSAELAKILEGL